MVKQTAQPSSAASTQSESNSGFLDVTESVYPSKAQVDGLGSIMDGTSVLTAMNLPVNFHPLRNIAICGAVCGLGVLGINRYTRCPAKRLYGRLGLAAIFTGYSYDKSLEYSAIARLSKLVQNKNCQPILVEWMAFCMYCDTARNDPTSMLNQFRSIKPPHGEDMLTHFPSEERRLIEQERWNNPHPRPHRRVLMRYVLDKRFKEYGVSANDRHKLTLLFTDVLCMADEEETRENLVRGSVIAAAVGVLSPWRFLVGPMFAVTLTSLAASLFYGQSSYRYRFAISCIDALEDLATSAKAVEESSSLPCRNNTNTFVTYIYPWFLSIHACCSLLIFLLV